MAARLLSTIDARSFGGDGVRVADLNQDGAYELLFLQSDPCTREITCLTATDLSGAVLWQWGTPAPENGATYSDLAVQVHDWDGDGANEVLWVEQAIYAESIVWDYAQARHIVVPTTRRGELKGRQGWAQEAAKRYEENAIVHVLDAATGKEKTAFPIPAPADDCLCFANLIGDPGRRDLVVKDRYWNMWGISNEGRVLWHYAASNPGHFPIVGDVDGDGLDEICIGWHLLGPDGAVRWTLPGPRSHQDSGHLVQVDGETRIVFSHGEGEGLSGGVHCLTSDGTELWSREFGHAQIVVPGRFCPDLGPVQFAVADLGWVQPEGARRAPCMVVLDQDGAEVSRRIYADGTTVFFSRVDWLGGSAPHCLAVVEGGPFDPEIRASRNQPPQILDGRGEVVERLRVTLPDGREAGNYTYAMAADVWGDSREELLVTGRECLNLFTNAELVLDQRRHSATFYNGQ
ncbi:MAG: hypothetical protein WDA75_21820 [Candidatus Latescibacterota bacterium]|jgi:hypothetical protein